MFKVLESDPGRPGDSTFHIFRDNDHFFEFMIDRIDHEFDKDLWIDQCYWVDANDVRWEMYYGPKVWDHTTEV